MFLNFLQNCLKPFPTERYSAREALHDPFFAPLLSQGNRDEKLLQDLHRYGLTNVCEDGELEQWQTLMDQLNQQGEDEPRAKERKTKVGDAMKRLLNNRQRSAQKKLKPRFAQFRIQ